ncbi:hypothetical protein SEA_ERADICATOR_60 [Mycobacterium phage Eradicator]|nr:hypothetical protein SEA_ERADICATOR_60 [Mycobacterium phage Eradicator]
MDVVVPCPPPFAPFRVGASTTTRTTETTTHAGEPMSDHTGIEWTDATWNPVTGTEQAQAFIRKHHAFADHRAHIPEEATSDRLSVV